MAQDELESRDVAIRMTRQWGWGTASIEPPTHENQMKGRPDGSLGLCERKKKRGKKRLIKLSESACISLSWFSVRQMRCF